MFIPPSHYYQQVAASLMFIMIMLLPSSKTSASTISQQDDEVIPTVQMSSSDARLLDSARCFIYDEASNYLVYTIAGIGYIKDKDTGEMWYDTQLVVFDERSNVKYSEYLDRFGVIINPENISGFSADSKKIVCVCYGMSFNTIYELRSDGSLREILTLCVGEPRQPYVIDIDGDGMVELLWKAKEVFGISSDYASINKKCLDGKANGFLVFEVENGNCRIWWTKSIVL